MNDINRNCWQQYSTQKKKQNNFNLPEKNGGLSVGDPKLLRR